MKNIIVFISISLMCHTVSFGQWDPNADNTTSGKVIVQNPQNTAAVNMLSWYDNIARIRIGGNGVGAENGFVFQGVGDSNLLRILGTGYIGIGFNDPNERLEINGTTLINSRGNRGSAILKLDRGTEGKDAAVVSFGQSNNYTWHTGLLYNGGNPAPNFYISQNSSIIDGNGNSVHTPELTINKNGNIGIGTTTPSAKLEVIGDALINTAGTRGSAILKLDRGADGKDAAVVSFGQNNNYTWHTGLLYNGGSPTPNFYISQNNAIRDGNGNSVHIPELTINKIGQVGIGTTAPDAKLTVKGKIHAEEVKIDLSVPAPDYVFKKEYHLLTIEEVQQHITTNGHLPNIPSAKEMETNGVELGIMNMKLLEKIEELTLYTIDQEKQLSKQEERIQNLEEKLMLLLKTKN